MPTLVTSSSPTPPTSSNVPRKQRAKKPRISRRRGRARNGIESDEETIERLDSSASEAESDVSSSGTSTFDSDEESASEDELEPSQATTHTPNTSQSTSAPDRDASPKAADPFFSSTNNWSEMVADENANGAADLPVIDFSDFKAEPPAPQPTTRKPKKQSKKTVPSAQPTDTTVPAIVPEPSSPLPAPVSNDTAEHSADNKDDDTNQERERQPLQPKRPYGQTARQAYQQKLESDPSYVPKVGGFWGHDDRLMDKELRSLSGWWRGKWQGRGRGGRGGFAPGPARGGSHVIPNGEFHKEVRDDLPPIERAWTHDGYEEMRQREDQRSEAQAQRQTGPPVPNSARGRGGSVAVRGGRGAPRGGYANINGRAAVAAKQGRPWYTMKPEPTWTKQNENFLFFDSAGKYRMQGITYRIRLPGASAHVIKTAATTNPHLKASALNATNAVTGSVVGSEVGEASPVVRLPRNAEEINSPNTIDETPIEEIFTVRPRLVNVDPIPLPAPSNTKSSPPVDKPTHVSQPSITAADPNPSVRSQLEQLSIESVASDPVRFAQTEQAVLRKPTGETPAEESAPSSIVTAQRPSLPPIQTVYTPPPAQPSPAYAAPYGYPTLPPGIALNQHGMPYEIASGRPVYLPAPPPPPMYNPRPLMHSHISHQSISYMTPPPHMHHSAMSPDFLAHQPPSHSHTPSLSVNGFVDPNTGAPIFALPRSSRVEIRAPNSEAAKSVNSGSDKTRVSPPPARLSTHLNASATSFVNSPSHPAPPPEYGYQPYSSPSDANGSLTYASAPDAEGSQTHGHPGAPSMMPYQPYQQYYYPDPAYGYPPYVEMGQYEMYPPMETHGTSYY